MEMTDSVSVNGSIAVSAGPSFPVALTIDVNAYQKVDVTIDTGASLPVDLQFGDDLAAVKLLFLQSNPRDAGITYKPDAGAPGDLGQPLLLIGSDVAARFPKSKGSFTVSNATAAPAEVVALIGRSIA
jgi:hypothetical protein